MTVKFALVLSLFFTVSKHISSSILSSQLLTEENQEHLTSINAPRFLKANRDSDIYETSLKNSENAKLTQTYFGTETIHIKRKELGLHYEDETPLRFNLTKAENINLHNFPINKTAKDQIPFKINSAKSKKINLHNFLINQTAAGQNVQLKRMQFDVINNPHEKADITSNTTKNIKKMGTRFKKVSPNVKNKVGTDAKSDKYALKKVFQGDFYKPKSDFQRNFQNINVANLKHGHWLEMRPLRKRKIRDATIYPKELEPVFRKFFPEDFTTKESHLYSNNFRKLSDLVSHHDSSHKRNFLMFKDRNPISLKSDYLKRFEPYNKQSLFYQADNENVQEIERLSQFTVHLWPPVSRTENFDETEDPFQFTNRVWSSMSMERTKHRDKTKNLLRSTTSSWPSKTGKTRTKRSDKTERIFQFTIPAWLNKSQKARDKLSYKTKKSFVFTVPPWLTSSTTQSTPSKEMKKTFVFTIPPSLTSSITQSVHTDGTKRTFLFTVPPWLTSRTTQSVFTDGTKKIFVFTVPPWLTSSTMQSTHSDVTKNTLHSTTPFSVTGMQTTYSGSEASNASPFLKKPPSEFFFHGERTTAKIMMEGNPDDSHAKLVPNVDYNYHFHYVEGFDWETLPTLMYFD